MIDSKVIADPAIAGLTWSVGVEYDFDSGRPEDNGDCYTASQIEAWRSDEWHYVTLCVVPSVNGEPVDAGAQYLGGVEFGWYLLTDENDVHQGRADLDLDYMITCEDYYPAMREESLTELYAQLAARAAATLATMAAMVLAVPGTVPQGC